MPETTRSGRAGNKARAEQYAALRAASKDLKELVDALKEANERLALELDERGRMEKALRESEERYSLAVRGANGGWKSFYDDAELPADTEAVIAVPVELILPFLPEIKRVQLCPAQSPEQK